MSSLIVIPVNWLYRQFYCQPMVLTSFAVLSSLELLVITILEIWHYPKVTSNSQKQIGNANIDIKRLLT